MGDYLELNRANWDDRARVHAASPDYALDRFIADPQHLSDVVRFDLPRMGDVAGLRGVHLQCHLGTDTISLARLGARMTGLDFSPASLSEARPLAEFTATDVRFIESDVYNALDTLGHEQFDLVFTGIGALCWLPSVAHWADVVAGLLRPGGRLFLREGHPVLMALDDERDDGVLVLAPPTAKPSRRSCGTTLRPTSRPRPGWSTAAHTSGTTDWATSSQRCWTQDYG